MPYIFLVLGIQGQQKVNGGVLWFIKLMISTSSTLGSGRNGGLYYPETFKLV